MVKYHDMADVIDFIVLKQNYDQAMFYDWKSGIFYLTYIYLYKWNVLSGQREGEG